MEISQALIGWVQQWPFKTHNLKHWSFRKVFKVLVKHYRSASLLTTIEHGILQKMLKQDFCKNKKYIYISPFPSTPVYLKHHQLLQWATLTQWKALQSNLRAASCIPQLACTSPTLQREQTRDSCTGAIRTSQVLIQQKRRNCKNLKTLLGLTAYIKGIRRACNPLLPSPAPSLSSNPEPWPHA